MKVPVRTGITDAAGRWTGLWNGDSTLNYPPHSSISAARLAKVQCPGYQPAADWITTFDLQAGMIMPSGGVVGDYRYPGKWNIEVQKVQ